MPKIILNEKQVDSPEDDNLLSFLQARNIAVDNLILEFNGQILTGKDPLGTIILKDGDRLNLFSMVGGG
jgi:thiamine biosynthesis protein ThiS